MGVAMAENGQNRVLSIEEVLADEADAIAGGGSNIAGHFKDQLGGKKEQEERFAHDFHRSADEREDTRVDPKTIKARKELYRKLNELKHAALCFSGGGIRSATFCLGILQALAACDGIPQPTGAKHQFVEKTPLKDTLLGCFHYLSTVSGGGYVGSWLSAWRIRASFADIIADLTGRPSGADFEPPQISWLRAYSNYLTPRLGIGSADSWAAVAIVVRNLILNWFVIIPVVAFAVLALKFVATVSVWIARDVANPCVMIPLALGGAILLIFAQAFTNYHRPALLPPDAGDAAVPQRIRCWLCWQNVHREKGLCCRRVNGDDTCFVRGDLIWAALSAIVLTIFFTSHYFGTLLAALSAYLAGSGCLPGFAQSLALTPKIEIPTLTAIAGFITFAIGWIAGWPQVFSPRDWVQWALSGLIYGALVGLGAYLFTLLTPYPPHRLTLLVGIIFGVPWIIMCQLAADNIFGGLVSYEPQSDSDREWLGRASGWLAAFAVAWAIVAFLVFAGEYAVQLALNAGHQYVLASGGVVGVLSGAATALLGSSSKTPAKSSGAKPNDYTALAYNVGLAVAGPIFAALLIVALSIALDKVLFNESLINLLQGPPSLVRQTSAPIPQCVPPSLKDVSLCLRGGTLALENGTFSLQGGTLSLEGSTSPPQRVATAPKYQTLSKWSIAGWFIGGFLVLWAVACIASRYVNINRFSLHALYRNRLVRAYLGATRDKRHPNRFTGFDGNDNVRMHELWTPATSPRRLFHVVNIALNVVSTRRLAWQERKAEPFIVTPRHCGGAYVGFRPSRDYGDSHDLKTDSRGIALGTAMAISGAAVSPNMGYNSSPSVALLLTLLNVRLGWWLGNPGPAGDKDEAYKREGPKLAAKPLFDEALGLTTDQSPYVYLSDGGHFENLGLYEMVRRRCRLIVVVDAGCDPKFVFEDLGNAVRKIYMDLGVRVTFDALGSLLNRPTRKQLRGLADSNGQTAENAAEEAAPIETASEDEVRKMIPYYAIGTAHYAATDGEGCHDGTVIYIKPAYHGIEGAAVRSYAKANETFPHETTADQWFTESQFESYRALGLDIGHAVLASPAVQAVLRDYLA